MTGDKPGPLGLNRTRLFLLAMGALVLLITLSMMLGAWAATMRSRKPPTPPRNRRRSSCRRTDGDPTPHPPFGHLLPQGEKGTVRRVSGDQRLGDGFGDEAAAEYLGGFGLVGIEDAGLARRDAVFAADEGDIDLAVAHLDHRRLRPAGRAHLDLDRGAIARRRLGQRQAAEPVDVAQAHGVGLEASRGPTMTRPLRWSSLIT